MSTNSNNQTSDDSADLSSVQHNNEEEDDVSSSAGSSKRSSAQDTLNSGEKTNNTGNVKQELLSSRDAKAVTWSRLLMMFVLLGLAVLATVKLSHFARRKEEQVVVYRYEDHTSQIIANYMLNIERIIDTHENLALQISVLAQASYNIWPFVTIPGFEAQGTRVLEQSGARTMAVAHFVQPEEQEAWQNYTAQNQEWVQESMEYYYQLQQTKDIPGANINPVTPYIWDNNPDRHSPVETPVESFGFYAPIWQEAPIASNVDYGSSNYDSFRNSLYAKVYDQMIESNGSILNDETNISPVAGNGEEEKTTTSQQPESFLLVPIYKDFATTQQNTNNIVATISSLIPWDSFFRNALSDGTKGTITAVVSTSCNDQTFTYEIAGRNVTYLGAGDLHDNQFDNFLVETDVPAFTSATRQKMESCVYNTLRLYPTEDYMKFFERSRESRSLAYRPLFAVLLVIVIFSVYDCMVERRQNKVMTTAERSTAIVSSLFPQQVAQRLMEQEEQRDMEDKKKKAGAKTTMMLGQAATTGPDGFNSMVNQLNGAASGYGVNKEANGRGGELSSRPIAELFPSATVLFADIVGFTAWSSSREPSQVFELLEEIYSSFDIIARRKKVFKVETIGDCYMAATGLPEKRDDHAILMARFARDCLRRMLLVVRKLEVRLGPDTAELGMRIGIHSGPVTAGVLRGEKARFQLFGDTVNTAARMEQTGARNKIHVSDETAELIKAAGHKDIWTAPRKDMVEAKGKGKLRTHWLSYTNQGGKSVSSSGTTLLLPSGLSTDLPEHSDMATTEFLEDSRQKKLDRSIDWGVDILQRLLKQVIAMRGGMEATLQIARENQGSISLARNTSPLEEFKDIIELPSQERSYPVNPSDVELSPEVFTQLRDFVKAIASIYRPNPFHSFEHATHVTQSVTKLLTRVVAPADTTTTTTTSTTAGTLSTQAELHQYTHGITSDPLAQFAVAFSALIHDVDHPGVPNATLVQEKTANATLYKNKSVAEQNSVDVAWDLLSEPYYAELRACIFTNASEYGRFRQLVVNTVMATDIVDKELGATRKKRWEDAFSASSSSSPNGCLLPSSTSSSMSKHCHDASESVLDANRKATIVIEHLIQASDVAHTMQHWHVYLKWNNRFFNECYKGYLEGRVDKDPSEGWYKGELGFFDHYIIPLARKLKDCEVFGVASDEYLQYAEANRREWEKKGEDLVKSYVSGYRA